MERTRTTLLLLLVVGLTPMIAAAAAAPPAAATPAQVPAASTPAIAAAGEPQCSTCLKCPCGCSPLAGAWVAKLSTSTDKRSSSMEESIIQTFKFAPINDGCTKFVVNSQSATRLAKVAKFFPDACDQTEFVGIACKDEWKDIKLTAISYGVQHCATPETRKLAVSTSGETTKCPTTTDKVVFIAIMTARIEIPESCLECDSTGKYNPDPKSSEKDGKSSTTDDQYTGECKEPRELKATIFISYFDAAQDIDRDGFPDEPCDEPVLCLRFETCLKRVELMEPCEAENQSFTACLGPCQENGKDVNTPATGRAFIVIDEDEQDVDAVVTVQNIKDVTKAALQINGEDVLILFPIPPEKAKEGEVEGLLVCAEIPVKNFIGSLKGKKLEDLVKAIEEGKVTVVVSTKKFPKGEICGTVEDP